MKYTIIPRKLIAFLMSFLLLMSLFPAAVGATDAEENGVIVVADEVALQAQELLVGLDMLEAPQADLSATISRADFAKLLAGMVRYNGFTVPNSGYRDVTEATPNAGEISFVVEQGYMVGDKGLFRPGNAITYAEAARALVEMTGNNLNQTITADSEYLMKASGLGISRTIESNKGTDLLSAGAAYKMAANTLTAKSVKMSAISNGYVSDVETGNFLEVMLDVKRVVGVLTKTKTAGIYSAGGTGKNAVEIDQIRFLAREDWTNLLGYQVNAYIHFGGVDAEVLHMTPSSNNEAVELKAENILSVNSAKTKIVYAFGDDEDDEEEMDLTTATTVVWNGSFGGTIVNYSPDQLSLRDASGKPKAGSVRLIDFDGDKVADVLNITSYEMYYLASADDRTEWMTDTNRTDATKVFKMDAYKGDARFLVYESGAEATFDLFDKEQVVHIAESFDKKRVTAIIGETEAEVTVTQVRNVNGVDEYYADGQWYRGNDYFYQHYHGNALAPTVGWHGYFKLDIDGRITATEYDSEALWGYLIAIGAEPGLTTQNQAKIFTNYNTELNEHKVIIMNLASRVQVSPGNGAYTTYKEEDVKDLSIFKNGSAFKDQLIRFTVNDDDEINKIITADTSHSWDYTQLSTGDPLSDEWYNESSPFALCYDATKDGPTITADDALYLTMPQSSYTSTMLLGNKFLLDANHVPFWIIPTDLSDEKMYAYGTREGWSLGTTPDLKVYDMTKNGEASAAVWRRPSGATENVRWENYKTLLITEVKKILNDEGVVTTQISGYRQYQWSQESMGIKTFTAVDETLLADIQVGDLIQYQTNSMEKITHIRYFFDRDKLGTALECDPGIVNDNVPGLRRKPVAAGASNGYTNLGYDALCWGKLIATTPKGVIMSFQSPDDPTVVYGNNTWADAKMSWFQWLIVDTTTDEVWKETTPTVIHTLLDVENPEDATDVLLWTSNVDKVSMGILYLKL